ncbi:MAG: TIGR04084 family radical SAM/SPASM domain-containing protein [Candidatus Bathyarchaeia archaeon]
MVKSVFFHVILTTACNLECRYCFGEAIEDFNSDFNDFDVDYSLPKKIGYNIDMLNNFCKKDSNCTLIFYGGEPLLCINEIKQIIDCVKAKYFIIQTNGLLLHKLEPAYVNRFHTIIASIDGDENLTDYYRGRGVYRKVIDNLKLVKSRGFKGEIIARMTVMEQTDIYRQVLWLLNNEEFPFSSVHWQLNAGFWSNDYPKRNFKEWVEKSYNPGIRKLAKYWINQMKEKGVVRLYPFMGIAQSMLKGEENSLLRCGAGWINYAIQTDGTIIPCPSMWGIRQYYLGHISTANPLKLRKVLVGEPCTKCNVYPICGGRCLYANITKRWSKQAYSHVCNTVKNLIEAINEQLPKIEMLIEKGKINLNDFEFLMYNGCEIIP